MRVNIEYVVHGSTVNELIGAATERWKLLTDGAESHLPLDAELHVSSDISSTEYFRYLGKVFIRSKVEN
jgi:hypothetical protein